MKELRTEKLTLVLTPTEKKTVLAYRDTLQLIRTAKVSIADVLVETVQYANGKMPLK